MYCRLLEGVSEAVSIKNEKANASITGLTSAEVKRKEIERIAQESLRALVTEMDKFHSLVGTIDGIVWEVDAQTFEFKFVSKQAEIILGYPF